MAQPISKGQQDIGMQFSNAQVLFDPEAFDEAIRSHGVLFAHWRGMKCPVGIVDIGDSRRPHDDHSGCSNGFIYTMAGTMTCLFGGNNTQPQFQEMGILDGSNVNVTLPRFYDNDGSPVYVAPFDRLYLAEESIVVVDWQLHEAHITGKDRLNHPVVKVQDLIDTQGIRYTEGRDFEIQGGQIVWTATGSRPVFDPDSDKGPIYACRYLYRPYFYVKRLEHEVRVITADGPDGTRHTVRMQQACSLAREYIFENEQKDPESVRPDSPRQIMGPASGSFGPR